MARKLVFIFIFLFVGCQKSNTQFIQNEIFQFNDIKFDTVSKKLISNVKFITPDEIFVSEFISKWFENKIKINGFEGDLIVEIDKILMREIKELNYFKYSIDVTINFKIYKKNNLSKTFSVSASEFGVIEGNFAIKDQENLKNNLIMKSIKNIHNKIAQSI